MVKERAQKKSFQQSLEDIKEKMKEKRNKRLASASAPSRGRPRIIHKSSGAMSANTILIGVQENNKTLAVALQSEKEKVRQANAVILQLKREQQALFLHLLLLKRKLKEREALTASASETKATNISVEPQHHRNSARRKRTSENLDEPVVCKASPISAEPQTSGQRGCDKQLTLPASVVVRRGHTDRRNKRRSECVQEQRLLSGGDATAGLETLIASPIQAEDKNPNQPQPAPEPELADLIDTEEFQHSTPEQVPPKKSNQKQSNRKQAQQQPRTKQEAPARKAERGRRPERAQLKKPWDKPRARSKSRDRSATRSKAAPPSQGNKLNTSLGFNDTFDFDCEETVHVAPFRAKAEGSQPATPISEEAPQREQAQTGASPVASRLDESSSSSPSSESEDSLYVPQKTRRRQTSLGKTKAITTRRGRPRQKENIPPNKEISVFRDEESSPKTAEPEEEEAHLPHCPDSSFSNSPNPEGMEQETHQEPHREIVEEDCLLAVSPLVEAEMMRIDNVLHNFRDPTSDTAPLLPHLTPQRIKTCKRRGLGVRTAGRGLSLCDVTNMSPAAYRKYPSDGRCSTPVPARKRRCTMVVDYKEPSLNGKLRRGDKFTDLQFLRSPIFKGKTDSRKPRNSVSSKQPFEKYNESFVGCR
ncbi:shugoshin 1 isoform X1 [Hippoglossus hippoglossus]|uniref:shugoshin 1 isoform X1 n=1 Tax=Hippoglossus hippoglossus TaxID=8267 RepID=UPI00148DBD47|nr:shugoshin 1 isoform X1 [Hippoglossus hippoglossus]